MSAPVAPGRPRGARGAPLAAIVVAAALLGAGAAAPSSAAAAPRVTVIGDSIQASFEYVPAAVRRLGKGLDLRVDARVCRRLVASSCSYDGSTPLTAVQLVRSAGSALGPIVVVNVGYNDDPGRYDVDGVMRALRAAGVRIVVWTTLREQRRAFAATNARIRAAARRWEEMRIADWNAVSAGRPWFGSDGLHLNAKGAMALSGLQRQRVWSALP